MPSFSGTCLGLSTARPGEPRVRKRTRRIGAGGSKPGSHGALQWTNAQPSQALAPVVEEEAPVGLGQLTIPGLTNSAGGLPGALRSVAGEAVQSIEISTQITGPIVVDRPLAPSAERPPARQGGSPLAQWLMPILKPAVYATTPAGRVTVYEQYGKPTDYSAIIGVSIGVALARARLSPARSLAGRCSARRQSSQTRSAGSKPLMSASDGAKKTIALAVLSFASGFIKNFMHASNLAAESLGGELVAQDISVSRPGFVLMDIATAPLYEEIIYRQGLQELVGIVPASIAFGLAHGRDGENAKMSAFRKVDATIGGLIYGAAFNQTGLVGSVACHALHNLGSIVGVKTALKRETETRAASNPPVRGALQRRVRPKR
jgi:membrane protease YdiL (CAAX protease family)